MRRKYSLAAKIAFAILVCIGALREGFLAGITLMILVYIRTGVRRKYSLAAKIAFAILVCVSALGKLLFTNIALVVFVFVCAAAEDVGAVVAFVILVCIVMNGAAGSAAAKAAEVAGCQGKKCHHGKRYGKQGGKNSFFHRHSP